MATRTIRAGVSLVIPDLTKSVSEIKDAVGVVIRHASVGVKTIPPGEMVELDEEEADRIEARWPWQPTQIVDASVTRMQSAPPTRRVAR
ncbi:hypothetical protein OPKNFCMD_4520 [Methylobacterium crusticola]|uniref:Uncharacterized protein n=1 Tax=Methylobacterium crusticola TaxID=1697972 RepID=A0ABQ4R259_9HYPH|nr:hypothetical protein [Methylobacterium crusticola]GJD51762.1 hypothetical protein OPKNFCMD_4520 [Methylobacterium crusticola]